MVLATKKNCQRVLAASLRVVSAMTGNLPLIKYSILNHSNSHLKGDWSKSITIGTNVVTGAGCHRVPWNL